MEEYKEFFEKIIEFDSLIEIRILHLEKEYMFSEYVSNFEELKKLIKKYDYYPFNMYYGINTRKTKGKKDIDVENRRIFYFDIEGATKKELLTNKEYFDKIQKTTLYIMKEMNKQFKFLPAALYVSGKGVHLLYKTQLLERIKYDDKFKQWFKQVQIELDKNKPCSDIKFSDSVFNISRISGLPLSHHNKYKERPQRKLLFYNTENICNLAPILDNFELKVYPVIIVKGAKKKSDWIYTTPEFKVFKLGIPKGAGWGLNNKLRFALALLMKKHGLTNTEEVARRLQALGYSYKPISIPDDRYQYSEKILNRWVLDHWEFCLEKKFKLPYKIMPHGRITIYQKTESVEFRKQKISNFNELLKYVEDFNFFTFETKKDFYNPEIRFFYLKALKENVLKNCEPKFREFVEFNNLVEEVGLYTGGKMKILHGIYL